MIDDLHVYELRILVRKRDGAPAELFDEYRDVEPVGIESGDVRATEELCKTLRDVPEFRFVGDGFVCDMMHRRGGGRYGDPGVDEPGLHLFPSVRIELQDRDLNDPVPGDVHSRRLEVEKDKWSLECELHVSRGIEEPRNFTQITHTAGEPQQNARIYRGICIYFILRKSGAR